MFDKEIKLLNNLLAIAKNYNNCEPSYLEFKQNNIQEIGEYISALSNASFWKGEEYGYLVFGIEDKTFVKKGITGFDPFDLRIGNSPMEMSLSPAITGCAFEFMPLTENNLNFLIVKIGACYSTLAKYNKDAYFRIGENKTKLNQIPEWEAKLWQKINNKRPSSFLSKIVKGNLTKSNILELLDYETYYKLINNTKPPQNQDLIIERFVDEGLIIPNNNNFDILGIGAILFARDMNSFLELRPKAPEVITYNGDYKLSEVVKTQTGTKGYAVGFQGLVDYIFTQIREPESIGTLRTKQRIYPEVVIRELVANALIHQDFEIGSRVMIEIFDTHIDISNGGGCLFDSSRIIDHTPKSRNEVLADTMRRLRIGERRGSGVDRTIEAIQTLQLPPPKFVDQGDAFISKIYSYKEYAKYTEEEKQRACVQFVALNFEHGRNTTNEDLRIRFGISEKSSSIISRLVKKCIDKNLLKKFDPVNNSKKNTSYIPIYG